MRTRRSIDLIYNHNGLDFLFGYEQKKDAAIGIQVSHWRRDYQVVKTRLTTEFVKSHLLVFKEGFGSRHRSECHGSSNVYINARGSKRPFPSPLQDPNKVGEYQYYRETSRNHLVQPQLEKILHTLALSVQHMKLDEKMAETAEKTCGVIIATTGVKLLGFCNQNHVDECDRYTPKQLSILLEKASSEEERRTLQLKNSGSPTTCGYQIVKDSLAKHSEDAVLNGEQFFLMRGLGMAVEICDGVCHRFLGSVFEHCTSACLGFREGGDVTVARMNDSFFIYAWGAGKNTRRA